MSKPVLIVELNDAAKLAASKSNIASFVGKVAPESLREMVYSELLKQVKGALDKEGVDADVRVVNSDLSKNKFSGSFLEGAGITAGIFGVGYLAYYFLKGKRK